MSPGSVSPGIAGLIELQIRLMIAAGATTFLSVALTRRAWTGTSRTMREAAEEAPLRA